MQQRFRSVIAVNLLWALPLVACGPLDAKGSDFEVEDGLVGSEAIQDKALGVEPNLPLPTGECPDFVPGEQVSLTFAPAGIAPREVLVWIGEATQPGPLVFYWHASASGPNEAILGIGREEIDRILGMGGMVVSPTAESRGFPWYLTYGSRTDDLILADEVVGCANQRGLIDPKRIHSLGMSAGAFHTAEMSWPRSNYLASVATFSGGITGNVLDDANPENRFAALIFFGGDRDFWRASERYQDLLIDAGRPAFVCNHGRSHTPPLDARACVLDFFLGYPFGTNPAHYDDGLPASCPDYCDP